jgi:hypothetical protein
VTFAKEQEGRQKKRLVEIKFYLTPEEFTNMEQIAMYIYREKAIPKLQLTLLLNPQLTSGITR